LIGGETRHLKRPLLQPPIPDGQTVAVPIKNLQLVAPPVDEQEQVAAQRVLLEYARDNALQAVEAFAHVGRPGEAEDSRVGGETQHAEVRSAARCAEQRVRTSSTRAMVSLGASAANRKVKPPGVPISTRLFSATSIAETRSCFAETISTGINRCL